MKSLFPITIYCADTGFLINFKHYRRDINTFKPIWDKIEEMIKNKTFISHIEVFKEIKEGKDEIYEWSRNKMVKKMFKDVDQCQTEKIKEIQLRYDKNYWERNSSKPVWADPWVIALAICEDAVIVADEKNAQNRIPYIANHFNLRCLNRFDFFKEIGL